MRALVTGAAGFIGSKLLDLLRADPSVSRITAIDLAPSPFPATKSLRWVSGAIGDAAILDETFTEGFDCVYHLVSVPGGLAEREPRLGRRVNLDASLDLLDRLAAAGGRPRFVYASSIAVYGELGAGPIGSRTPTNPMITYGAHKRMVEIALADFTRRGDICGIALRLPGVIARPGASGGLGSAFMSDLPRAFSQGQSYVCPVSREATCWWMSAATAAANLRHAAGIEATGVYQLPALHLSVGEIVGALSRAFGEDRERLITYKPQPAIEAVFGRFPALEATDSRLLGFTDDGSAAALLKAALG